MCVYFVHVSVYSVLYLCMFMYAYLSLQGLKVCMCDMRCVRCEGVGELLLGPLVV